MGGCIAAEVPDRRAYCVSRLPKIRNSNTITMNLAIDLLRRRCRRSEVELDDAIPSFHPGPAVNHNRAEIREQVYAALAQLTPEHRAVILLKEIEDLHCHEIAEILNISLGTVLSRLFYGRKKHEGAKIRQISEDQAKLLSECEDGSTLDVTIVVPGNSVIVRNKDLEVEYLG